jgi:hypothetical protein
VIKELAERAALAGASTEIGGVLEAIKRNIMIARKKKRK